MAAENEWQCRWRVPGGVVFSTFVEGQGGVVVSGRSMNFRGADRKSEPIARGSSPFHTKVTFLPRAGGRAPPGN
jgi:hypothetical protein